MLITTCLINTHSLYNLVRAVGGHTMSEIYLCRTLGVKVGGGFILEGGEYIRYNSTFESCKNSANHCIYRF